mgnify:CR=1 FL=1
MDLKQIVDLIMIILGVVITLVPYVAALLIRTKNRFLQGVGKEAIKITSALEETSLSGEAKKAAAVSKLDQMFGFISRLIGLKLTPEQFADQVDAAVAILRTLGIKEKATEITVDEETKEDSNV